MSLCKTCEHWHKFSEDEYGTVPGSGRCYKIPHLDEVTEQREDDDWNHRHLRPDHAAVLAMAQDGSGYAATLITMPDFGCVLHSSTD